MCSCRKGFVTLQALLSLIERWKNTLDQNGYGCAILMDLLKAFGTINPLMPDGSKKVTHT